MLDIGYDDASSSGQATLDAIRNMPIAGDPLRVLMILHRRSRKAA